MGELFTTVLVKPIFNLLIVFYGWFGNDLGIAIIAITILIKIVFYPLQTKALRSQKRLQEIQPKIEAIRKKFHDQKELQAQELMKLYKEEKINPFSSCLPLLIQLPILIAVYRVFTYGIGSNSNYSALLYTFVQNPGPIHTISLGFLDITSRSIPLAVVAALAQYWQNKMLLKNSHAPKKSDSQNQVIDMGKMNKQMLYTLPIVTLIFGIQFPAGLTLYWLVTTLLMIGQQYLFLKHHKEVKTAVNNQAQPQS